MPPGVYKRTDNQKRAAIANLAKGREPKARAKATKKLRQIAQDVEWRERVSAATTAAMADPEVKRRHREALEAYHSEKGYNFKGGNGMQPTPEMELASLILEPLGFTAGECIRTAGHKTAHNPPRNYKPDFVNRLASTIIELDGVSHRPHKRQAQDKVKTEVLESLGWKVIRVNHRRAARSSPR